MPSEYQAVVIGGGVTGLCTAFYLQRRLGAGAVAVLEANTNPGGTARTDAVDGFLCDWGPNGFLDREPRTLQWMDDLGLSSDLIKANALAAKRFIMKDGRLIEIAGPPKFFVSPLLSIPGRLRLMGEPLIRQKADGRPETIWDFAARRIGAEAADTMVSPMVTGIFGGDAKQLSLEHCFPRMAAMERDYGGLYKALKAKRRENKGASAMGPGGTLTTLKQGMGQVASTAQVALGEHYRSGAAVTTIERLLQGFRVSTTDGPALETKSVVVAVPAYAAASMINGFDTALSAALGRIAYADIAVLCTAYKRDRVGHDMNGFGFLIPRKEGKRTLGCIWTSSLFPHQAPDGWVMLRSMYGGYTDPDAVRMTDSGMVDCLKREIHPLLKIDGDPDFVRIYRHFAGIPQYLLHHGELLAAIEAGEQRHPGLVFAGNAYRGVGLNDCVLSAHRACDRLHSLE
ncbi:MAG: hypothetical protein AMXMBFR84_47660 [Candidatus Hydrogenedentota bacterium]